MSHFSKEVINKELSDSSICDEIEDDEVNDLELYVDKLDEDVKIEGEESPPK